MRTPAWLRHRPALIVTALCALAGHAPTALAQSPASQPQEPARPDPPEVSLFDNRVTKPTPLGSWLSGFKMKCTGCGGVEGTDVRPEITTATSPWVLQGRWQHTTPIGVVSTGFLGVRNYGLPMSSAIPLGGELDPRALRSGTTAFAPFSQWSLTAAVEKTLFTSKSGATVGVVSDLLMPLRTGSAVGGDPRVGALTSPTLRFGIVFRW